MSEEIAGIMLVDDDEVDVMNVKRAFKKSHIKNPLFVAGNGLEALEKLRATDESSLKPYPKIILLDINMPKMNGIEFLEIIRKDEKLTQLSVIVLTTSNEERDKVAAYNLNVAGYILKPVETESFISAVSTLNLYWTLNELP